MIMGDVGGAFGQKMFPMREEFAVAAASPAARPAGQVDRGPEREPARRRARARRADDGLARHRRRGPLHSRSPPSRLENVGAYPFPGNGSTAGAGMMIFPGRTAFRGSTTSRMRPTPTPAAGAPTAGPWMMETVAREQAVDLAARRLGIDPLELRRRNVIQQAELPYQSSGGFVYDSISPAETLEQAAELIGYDAFRGSRRRPAATGATSVSGWACTSSRHSPSGRSVPKAPRCACCPAARSRSSWAPAATARAWKRRWPRSSPISSAATSTTSPSCRATPPSSPYGAGTGGSRSAVVAAGAARVAAVQLRERVLDVAAAALEAAAVRSRDRGRAGLRSRASRRIAMTLAQIADLACSVTRALPPEAQQGLEVTARFKAPPFTFSNACHACTVEVDPRTGEVQHPAVRRERGLRRDDQSDGRRGPDRRWCRAGHRRHALRAFRLRRRRQSADDDVPRLPAADGGGRRRESSTATSSRRPRCPAAPRGWARAAPSPHRRPSSMPSTTRLAPLGAYLTEPAVHARRGSWPQPARLKPSESAAA